jgi:mRNA interferase MazF
MVEKGRYVPERGDIVELLFSPQQGHEQAGKRPALVLSPRAYNSKTSLFIVCPITSKEKGYPFEVALPEGHKTYGAVLADQIKSLDWTCRSASFIEKAPEAVYKEVVEKIMVLIR